MSAPLTTGYGYDPARIVALRHRTVEAIEALRNIRCDDPLADDAVRVVRLMCQNLEDSWLPLVEAIHSSTAMVEWRREVDLDGGADGVISQLVRHFDAVSQWIGTAGLEELRDDQLVERLGTTSDGLLRSLDGHGDLMASWTFLARLLDELAGRLAADHDRVLARRLAEQLGADGVRHLVSALDGLAHAVDHGLLVGRGVSREDLGQLSARIASVLGAMASVDRHLRDELVDQVTSSSHLALTMADHPRAFDPITLLATSRELLAFTTGTGAWANRPRVVPRHDQLSRLLLALSHSPVSALALLTDDGSAAAIFTAQHLDDDATEAIVAAALSARHADPALTRATFELLAVLVDTGARQELNPGTRRATALSWAGLAPLLTPTLDARLPVDVVVPGRSGATHVVSVGTYDELAALLGQVVDDETAQLTLGATVGAFRRRQLEMATAAIVDRPAIDPVEARAQIAAALADVSRLIDVIEHSVERRDQLHAFRHGMERSQATSVVTLLSSLVSWYAPGAPVTGRVTTLTSRAVVSAIGTGGPATVPDLGVDARHAVDFLATIVALPTRSSELRTTLGLGSVDPGTWDDLDELLDRLDGTEDPAERSRLHARIRHLVDADPDLDTYVESIAAASGEAALARP